MVAVLILALFLILIFIVEIIKSEKRFNQDMKEYDDIADRIEIRASEFIKKERKYDARYKHKKYKLPNGAYGRK